MILQTLFLWDFHVVRALRAWRVHHGTTMPAWIRALGEMEALAALATLAHDNPSWTFPVMLDDGSSAVTGIALAHPLMAIETRVANDVTIGPHDTVLLVNGSNMAGKSTLLRSIGLNVVLAQLGAPVCASSLSMPPVRLRTSIHAQDVLEEGLSLFMAELLRLKGVVDSARLDDGVVSLYLLDEMLRGTNSVERRIAVCAIIGHLVRAGAIGAVSTHDLEMITDPSLAPFARPVHFSEQYRDTPSGPEMWFDYRLRPGVGTSRNAIKLLELVGLTIHSNYEQ